MRHMRPKRASYDRVLRVRPTAYGWMLVFLLVWVPVTALFTANNFLLIIFIMMAGLAFVSHMLGARNVRSVAVSRQLPGEIFAGTPFAVRYRIRGGNGPWGAMTLLLREVAPLEAETPGTALWKAPPGEEVTAQGFMTIRGRGQHRLGPGIVESAFPFGLALYSRTYGKGETVLVYPKIEPVDDLIPFHLGGFGRGSEKADPAGTIPYTFRDYVPGDPYKHIDWKKTAQTGSLTTRIWSEEGTRDVTIRLPKDASERAISRAASLVVHFAQKGTPVRLEGPGFVEGPARGRDFARRLLTILALWPLGVHGSSGSSLVDGIVVNVREAGDLSWTVRGEAHALPSRQTA